QSGTDAFVCQWSFSISDCMRLSSGAEPCERYWALAPGDGETCTPCSSGQHPECSAYVLRHHQDQPRPRPVAVGTECHVEDRRASLLWGGREIPAPRLCHHAGPSACIVDGRRRHDSGKGHAIHQGRILVPFEEGMRLFGGGLAVRLLRDARGRSAEFHEASGLHCGEPGESRTGRFAGGVPLLFHVPGSAKGGRGSSPGLTAFCGTAKAMP